MVGGSAPGAASPGVDVVGLGPGDLARLPVSARALLEHPGRRVFVRTLQHPAAAQLSAARPVEACDDLYLAATDFAGVYAAIAERVVGAAAAGPVVYAVPGSPLVGEFAVAEIRRLGAEQSIPVAVHPAESFLDAVLAAMGVDPLRDGFQLLNGHDLPAPLVLDKPTVVGHVDAPVVMADVLARLDRVLPPEVGVTVLRNLGSADAAVVSGPPAAFDASLAGLRTSLFVPAVPGGLVGAVHAMRRLRRECPWDRRQTHHSLVRYLTEEAFELADALAALPEGGEPDWGAYAEVEEELGDVLLQVLFHAMIASEAGAFEVDDVGEALRRKLVRRHPHVFGDVEAGTAEQVKANWDAIKAAEKGRAGSLLEGVPTGLPALSRAAEVQRRAARAGFDWPAPAPVLDKVREEVEELAAVLGDPEGRAHELGDLLFSVVNLARHLELEPEVTLRAAVQRFQSRFRAMEAMGPMTGLSLDELDARWQRAKAHGA